MTVSKSELLSIDEVAALIGKSIPEAKEIVQKSKLPIADKEGIHDLYDLKVIIEYMIKNSDDGLE